MKLLFLGSGDQVPSCRFRVVQLVPHLRAAGHKCSVFNSFPQKYDYFPWLGFRPSQMLKRLNRYRDLARVRLGNFDAVILERELFHNESIDMEKRFRRIAKTLVLDVDDAVFVNFPGKTEKIASMADLVLAGNPLLQEWASRYNANVEWMPTCIDTTQYSPARRKYPRSKLPVVGWMGTTGNVAFLKWAADGLRQAARTHPFELRVIAGERGVLDQIDLQGVQVRFDRWDPATEIDQLAEFDIGLMPLADDQWSRYKCGLKLLQYMALGIPGIASPVGVNASIVRHGENGYLAADAEHWRQALETLIRDKKYRESVGQAAVKTVEETYSIRSNLPRWIHAVEMATQRARLSSGRM
jgi:glycosyltransferase involved in cell wall biosynthesis